MDYTLDTNAAKSADTFFAKIEQKGKYLGTITRAEAITSKKGTSGIDLSFKADSGETADYLTIWTHNSDGKQLMGFNTLMAIMTCLRVKNLSAVPGVIEKYDSEQNKRVKTEVPLFKDLMDKPIGFLMFMEEYPKTAGGTGWKPVIASVFDKDEFTASEILSKATKPETLGKMILALKDRPLKMADNAPHPSSQPFDETDDIPFNC